MNGLKNTTDTLYCTFVLQTFQKWTQGSIDVSQWTVDELESYKNFMIQVNREIVEQGICDDDKRKQATMVEATACMKDDLQKIIDQRNAQKNGTSGGYGENVCPAKGTDGSESGSESGTNEGRH